MKDMKKLFQMLAVVFSAMLLLAGCGGNNNAAKGETGQNGALTIKMLDVGQGDAILVRTGSQTILFDTSDKDEEKKLIAALQKEKVTVIDKLISTHPHRDHMGGVQWVLDNISVKEVYDNGQLGTQKFYLNYLKKVKELKSSKGLKYKSLRAGDVLDFGNGVKFEVLSPTDAMVKDGGKDKDGKINLNLNSVEGRLVANGFTMMFTGDGEKESEQSILERYPDASKLKVDILKSPHHGSRTSSSSAFLQALQPKLAVISCGENNSYKHPRIETLNKYKKAKIDWYRTDINGMITIAVDANGKYTVSTEKGKKNDETQYEGAKRK